MSLRLEQLPVSFDTSFKDAQGRSHILHRYCCLIQGASDCTMKFMKRTGVPGKAAPHHLLCKLNDVIVHTGPPWVEGSHRIVKSVAGREIAMQFVPVIGRGCGWRYESGVSFEPKCGSFTFIGMSGAHTLTNSGNDFTRIART